MTLRERLARGPERRIRQVPVEVERRRVVRETLAEQPPLDHEPAWVQEARRHHLPPKVLV